MYVKISIIKKYNVLFLKKNQDCATYPSNKTRGCVYVFDVVLLT